MNESTLSLVEKNNLQYHEQVIEKGLASFIEVGESLMAIREGKLYRDEFPQGTGGFETYCKVRWGFTRSNAYKLMMESKAGKQIVDSCPQNEPSRNTARELAKVPTEKRQEVIERTIEKEGKLTAKAIRDTAKETEPVEVVEESKLKRPPQSTVDDFSPAMQYARLAVLQLDKINDADPERETAFQTVIEYIYNRSN